MPTIMLADNGSSRPAATLQLRQLASRLSRKCGMTIHPVSLQHADRIGADRLQGSPAQLLKPFIAAQLQQGQREFVLLPLFFGPSKAISSYVPEQLELLTRQYGEFSLHIADPIYPLPQGEPVLTTIIYEHILQTAMQQSLQLNNIVLVDHGSPQPQVTAVRQHLVQQLHKMLPQAVQLEQAVMERRTQAAYDFNGELLQHWLIKKAQAGETSAIVALQFFLPGSHAGAGGDILEICQQVMQQYPAFRIAICPLVADHPALIDILLARLQSSPLTQINEVLA
ncbi:MAG: cobalamin biosynthesis protein CbiX [Gammaproteobacteria bacterium]|nr:cobalamin biosynthesis protein CbiX [Gammaproteobacteria bacterium]MBL6999290.1 cobalamin biosynthesis protein CbiX [Gammaproteobacteria bacterium]